MADMIVVVVEDTQYIGTIDMSCVCQSCLGPTAPYLDVCGGDGAYSVVYRAPVLPIELRHLLATF